MEKPNKKINYLKLIALPIIMGLILILIKSLVLKVPSNDKSIFTSEEETLMKVTSDFNKNCPFMVDSETRFDNAIVFPGNILQYNLTLINWEKDSLNISETQKGIEPGLINGIKTSPNLKPFRDNKVTMAYHIRDKNGVFLFKIEVTPDLYLK